MAQIKNWTPQLWSLESPKIRRGWSWQVVDLEKASSHLNAQEPAEPMISFKSNGRKKSFHSRGC